MEQAAMLATTDIGGALEMLKVLDYSDAAFVRGLRFVALAHAQEMRLGYRSDNVESWVRWGFRILARREVH